MTNIKFYDINSSKHLYIEDNDGLGCGGCAGLMVAVTFFGIRAAVG
jgi:hypothetical protein